MSPMPPSVLHIASWYPSRMSPQNGNFIQRHVQAISRNTSSYVLHVVSDPDTDQWSVELDHEEDFHSAVVYYPRGKAFQKLSRNQKAHDLGYAKLLELAGRFDIIHVHVMYPAIVYGANLAKRLKIPIVVTEHATAFHSDHDKPYTWWQRLLLNRFSRKIRRFFPVSHDLELAMKRQGVEGDFEVIPNVVDTDLFRYDPRPSPDAIFRFIHISSLKDAHKNVSGLLSAFAAIHDDFSKTRLTIIGNAHHDQFQRYIRKLQKINEVDIHHEMPLAEVADKVRKSHVLVLFSNYENAPCVISEAQCAGLPIIATRVGGIPEMVTASDGILVQPGDMLDLYNAMKRMIEGYASFDQLSISTTASKRYDYQVVADQYLNAYETLIS